MTENENQRLVRLKSNLWRRAEICDLVRGFFQKQGFLEVETPSRVPVVAPEAEIEPFESEGWFLSTSPELYMKRLLAAGYSQLFQFSHSFRKGERGRWHNPEFALLEWYRNGADYRQIILDTEQMVVALANNLGFGTSLNYRGQTIDLSLPWPRLTVRDAFLQAAGWDPLVVLDPPKFDLDLVSKVVPGFKKDRPTVLIDYPTAMASLARLSPGNPAVAERAEIFIGGLELANIYSELRDVSEQERRFGKTIEQIRQQSGRQAEMPRKFLEALTSLPECGGAALGVDRLVMLFCDAGSIDEVKAFTVDTA